MCSVHLQPAKIYKLKHLSKVEVVSDDPSGCTFQLVLLLIHMTFDIFIFPLICDAYTYTEDLGCLSINVAIPLVIKKMIDRVLVGV